MFFPTSKQNVLRRGLMGNAKVVIPCAKKRFYIEKDGKAVSIYSWFNVLNIHAYKETMNEEQQQESVD
jgi:hypothetical protein